MKVKKTSLEIMKEAAERMGLKVFDYYPNGPAPARRKKTSSSKRRAKASSRKGKAPGGRAKR